MSTARRQSLQPRGVSEALDERLQFIRQVGRKRYYRDEKYPERGEFYLLDASMPLAHEPGELSTAHFPVFTTHPTFPEFGEYFIDGEGREVFVNDGKPFYMGLHEGKEHKITLGPNSYGLLRSRAYINPNRPSPNGTYRVGGVSAA